VEMIKHGVQFVPYHTLQKGRRISVLENTMIFKQGTHVVDYSEPMHLNVRSKFFSSSLFA
jgi:hypothetical protein